MERNCSPKSLGISSGNEANPDDLWKELIDFYGQGSGYRDKIADRVERWFEASELDAVRSAIDARLEKAWKELVLTKLVEQASLVDEVADE